MALLEIHQVTKTYHRGGNGAIQAVDGLSLSLEAGQFMAVKGPSGCGKTTLLLMAGGLLEPNAGEVRITGQNPYALSSDQRARFRAANIGFVFQQFHLVPYLSVLDNILASSIASGMKDVLPRANELAAHFGLQHRLHHVPGELSTGERQRTALARALLNQPKLLLADEPTGNLDRENADAVLKALTEFARHGGAVLLVSHDDHAVNHAANIIQLREGRMVN